ncbi:MAG: hypothetical protein D6696_02955 [Acidobacteria bacterium]|nr:MAG: hypothetical protein D6696_02955 [Acidobacteriota bacterium]
MAQGPDVVDQPLQRAQPLGGAQLEHLADQADVAVVQTRRRILRIGRSRDLPFVARPVHGPQSTSRPRTQVPHRQGRSSAACTALSALIRPWP